jgi:hypothetical protein
MTSVTIMNASPRPIADAVRHAVKGEDHRQEHFRHNKEERARKFLTNEAWRVQEAAQRAITAGGRIACSHYLHSCYPVNC